jgi:LPS export ABC transporter protein LptC
MPNFGWGFPNMKALSVVLLLSIGFLFVSCENDIEKIKLINSGRNEPVEKAVNIKILYSDSARVQVELTAPRMEHFLGEKPYLEMPKGFKALFYNDQLAVKSRLSADYGIRYENEQKMEAKKNVVVVNEKGSTLNTEHLIWDEQKQKLLSNEFVKITTVDEIIYGTGFEANQDFSQYRIFNIKGTIALKK